MTFVQQREKVGMSDTSTFNEIEQTDPSATFVSWLRKVAPYIHAFRGKTFVVGIDGELAHQGYLHALAQDLSLLNALGIRIVLVYGLRPQIQEQLALRNIEPSFHNGWRVTDKATLECALEAAGELRLNIEAAFSQGLPNTPMAHAAIRVISGNFVTASPVGILDGVDLLHTGKVRKIDTKAIDQTLANNAIVLLSPLGFSPTGEAFNLSLENVATNAAKALRADKLIFVCDTDGIHDEDHHLITELELDTAQHLLQQDHLNLMTKEYLRACIAAIESGVNRAHLVSLKLDGSVLLELFTHDGVGTMISQKNLESLRPATLDDAAGIKALIEPLEIDGTLIRRGLESIERDIDKYTVLEHDGILWGCAALYEYTEGYGELACLVVHPSCQGTGDGERLLKHIETLAKRRKLDTLFVLTTQTSHFFLKRGFTVTHVDKLPVEKKKLYNWTRKSQILIKKL